MKSRLHKIEIRNFKAFREFTLNLEGRHLLVYGDNGAGKSSLYWALYTFLQSARKPTTGAAGISKYFDPAVPQNLLNTHEQDSSNVRFPEIALTLRDRATKTDTTYRIGRDSNGQTTHGTLQQAAILKGDLASDFITYRFFFGFSHFRNSERFNLWPLFEKEILPFLASATTLPKSPLNWWHRIKSGVGNPTRSRGRGGTYAYDEFERHTIAFASVLSACVDTISTKAQEFYDQHFSNGDPAKVTLRLSVPKKQGTEIPAFPSYDRANDHFEPPIVEFGIQVDGKSIGRPQSHLNEAKMTQLGLSVRLAASLVNLHDPNNEFLKLLVLDDILVSLDMSNRMKVVDILLTDPSLANYQKIILTHDRGLFEEFRRMIGIHHSDWCFRTMQGNPKDGIDLKDEKDPLEKATDYLDGHDLEAAALQLRKAAEDTAQSYLKMATGKAPKPGEFHSLSQKLDKAKNILLSQLPLQLFKDVCSIVPKGHRDKLVRMNDDDIDADAVLTVDEKALIKEHRDKLKKFMTKETWKALDAIDVIDAVIQMKDRVLNPAAHWSETPFYDAEVRKALTLIARLEATLLK